MSRQSKQAAKRAARNAEGGPRDRHLEAQSRKRLCKHCGTTRINHVPGTGACLTGQTYGEPNLKFEPSQQSIRLTRRAKRIMKMRLNTAIDKIDAIRERRLHEQNLADKVFMEGQ